MQKENRQRGNRGNRRLLHPRPFPGALRPSAPAALAPPGISGGAVPCQGCRARGSGDPPSPNRRLARLLFPANADAGAELGRKLAIKR